MGFRFRKSINLGCGFKINISKSGVGYSWGMTGFRRTANAEGKVYDTYAIPGTGISYVITPNNKKEKEGLGDVQKIESAAVDNFQPAEHADFINAISKTILLNRISIAGIIIGVWCVFQIYLIIFLIIGIVLNIYLRQKCKNNIYYEMDDEAIQIYENKKHLLLLLNSSQKLWQIFSFQTVKNKKIHSGVDRSINRTPVRFTTKVPFYFRSNIETISIKLKKETLYFLPDKILLVRGKRIGTIEYCDISIRASYINFVEHEAVPKDTTVTDYTWQYVNKNGSRDKRFKNNRKLPKCKYGKITITSKTGLNVELQLSNSSIIDNFNNSKFNLSEQSSPEVDSTKKKDNAADCPITISNTLQKTLELNKVDGILEDTIELVVTSGHAQISFLQRQLKLSFVQASRLMNEMERIGVVGPFESEKPRKVLMTKDQLAEWKTTKCKTPSISFGKNKPTEIDKKIFELYTKIDFSEWEGEKKEMAQKLATKILYIIACSGKEIHEANEQILSEEEFKEFENIIQKRRLQDYCNSTLTFEETVLLDLQAMLQSSMLSEKYHNELKKENIQNPSQLGQHKNETT